MSWIRNRQLGLVYHDPDQTCPGYTLFSSILGRHATLLNMTGEIVHRWHADEGIRYAHLLPNGHLLAGSLPDGNKDTIPTAGGSMPTLFELDWQSNIVWHYKNSQLHHDFQRLPNGNFITLMWAQLPNGLTEQVRGGHYHEDDPERMWGDIIQEITPYGEVVYEWRSWEYLDVTHDIICPLESRKEWTHANSLCQTPEGDLLISFRLIDTVALIDRQTGSFKWKWGPDTLSHQHHASVLGNGHILIFDNGAHRRREPSFSQVLEVNPHNNEIVWRYKRDPLVAFYSYFISSAERLPNGNTLITEGAHGRLFEITPAGETVWEYISPFIFVGLFGQTPGIFRAHRYPADYSAFKNKDLSPHRYERLHQQMAQGHYLSDETK